MFAQGHADASEPVGHADFARDTGQSADAAAAIAGTAVGSGYDVAVAAGLRRLGGWLVQHGQRDAGKDVLRQAFVLDPEPMRRSATASIDSGGAGGGRCGGGDRG